MRTRLALAALVVLVPVATLFVTGAALSDTTTQPFTGQVTDTSCGTNDFAVPSNVTIDVTVTADVVTNDIEVSLVHNGAVVASTDAGVGQENIAYQPIEPGTYTVQVCKSSAPLGPFLPPGGPYTYTGTFTTTDLPVPVVPGSSQGTNGVHPIPAYSSWNAKFAPATIADPQRTEGEPLNRIDADGNIWESGPWGFSTAQSFIHRSTDGGKTFRLVSDTGTRPDLPPGGGDSDVATDDQGNVYFADLEGALEEVGTAVSNDNGNNWRKNPAALQQTAVDRQWLAIDNGPTSGAQDNTAFLSFHETGVGIFVYSSPGSLGATDPVGGFVWQNSAGGPGPLAPLAADATCAQLRFDPVTRNLYYACNEGSHIRITVGHVAPGQRTGIQYHNYTAPDTPGGGSVSGLFPALATDAAGNVYVAWIDKTNFNLYYSSSTDQGKTWSDPVRVNVSPSVTNEFDWAQGGAAGSLVLAWYGTARSTPAGSDGMPSALNDLGGATAYPWYGYAALVTAATSAAPTVAQARFTEKPMHYGNICNSGLGCTTNLSADRQMADFFGFGLDRSGALQIVFDDTTNEFDGAGLEAVRQVAGQSALGGQVKSSVPGNPVTDPAGDAQWPHYAPTGPGANLPQLDLTQVKLSNPSSTTLRVQLTASSLASLLPPPGKDSAVWLVRFQAAAPRPGGSEDVYRIFYVLAEVKAGALPSFVAGTASCQTTTPTNCKIFQYRGEKPADGQIAGNTITIDVGLNTGFGVPIDGKTLYNVTGFTFGRTNSLDDLYADVDSTPSFDYVLGSAKK